jgi:hypothetical protein
MTFAARLTNAAFGATMIAAFMLGRMIVGGIRSLSLCLQV